MKWWKKLFSWLRIIYLEIFGMGMVLEVDKQTGKIDSTKVKNVCLHFDGENYYFTALVNGALTFIVYTSDLMTWFQNSGISVCNFSEMWRNAIPEDRKLIECTNIPRTGNKLKI